jgi:hypothetical protein
MTKPPTAPGALTPARRLELLREIQDGGHSIKADSASEAPAALEAELAEWWELDNLRDIKLQTIHGRIGLTSSGTKFIVRVVAEHVQGGSHAS